MSVYLRLPPSKELRAIISYCTSRSKNSLLDVMPLHIKLYGGAWAAVRGGNLVECLVPSNLNIPNTGNGKSFLISGREGIIGQGNIQLGNW
jgi:hypothetical protein